MYLISYLYTGHLSSHVLFEDCSNKKTKKLKDHKCRRLHEFKKIFESSFFNTSRQRNCRSLPEEDQCASCLPEVGRQKSWTGSLCTLPGSS